MTTEWVAGLLPGRRDYRRLRESWPADLLAGLTVAVVALPLALAFGIAAGMGAQAGLVTAIVAGVAAGVFGGSHVQVSGPTGAMAVVLAPVVAHLGTDGVIVVTLLAGLVLAAAGAGRLGRYAAVLPWPVVEGFTVGIAALIFLQQVPTALGVPKPDGERTAVVAVRAVADWAGGTWMPLLVTALVAALMLALTRAHRTLPASLIAVAAVTLAAEAAGWDLPRIGAIPEGLPVPHVPGVPLDQLPGLVPAVLAVAALAAIESLLSAKVADGMSDDAQPHDPDRELVGQGVANVAASLFGGMPATGAIARTAVNVRAGARTRLATIVHGAALAGVVVAFAPLLGRVPLAALAGVLVVTSARMVDRHAVRGLLRSGRTDAVLLATTAIATVAFDLVVAVGIGVALACVLALKAVADSSTFDRDPIEHPDVDATLEHALLRDHIVAYRLDGALFFGAAQRFLVEMAEVADVEVVILRMGHLRMLDSTGAQALAELVDDLESRHITVLLACVREDHHRLLERVGVLDRLAHPNHVLPDIGRALEHARRHHLRNRARPAALAAAHP